MENTAFFRGIRVPTHIKFVEKEQDLVEMHIKYPEKNMQDNAAAFEAWSLILYANGVKKVELSYEIPSYCLRLENIVSVDCVKKRHMMRFLFRLWKFSEAMKWFYIKPNKCSEIVDIFKKLFESTKLVNNVAGSPAEISKASKKREHFIENVFARDKKTISLISPKCKEYPEELFNQLPSGLFKERVAEVERIFPTGFIDLWGMQNKELWIFELKDIKNTTAGIISELFFYANYAYHVFVKGQPEKSNGNHRGYPELFNAAKIGIPKLNACFLAPKYHKQIEKKKSKILEQLNVASEQTGIKYCFLGYDYPEMKKLADKLMEASKSL